MGICIGNKENYYVWSVKKSAMKNIFWTLCSTRTYNSNWNSKTLHKIFIGLFPAWLISKLLLMYASFSSLNLGMRTIQLQKFTIWQLSRIMLVFRWLTCSNFLHHVKKVEYFCQRFAAVHKVMPCLKLSFTNQIFIWWVKYYDSTKKKRRKVRKAPYHQFSGSHIVKKRMIIF